MDEDVARVREAYDRDPQREWQRLEGGAQSRLEYLTTTHALRRHLPPPAEAGHVLDAGGGPGRYTLDLARWGYTVTLLDLSPALLDLARRQLDAVEPAVRARVVAVVEGTIPDLSSFPDAHFGAVLCLGGPLSHLTDPELRRRAVAELRCVLAPRGLLFISVINRLGGYRSAVQWPGAWSLIFPHLPRTGLTTMGPGAAPTYTFLPEELVDLLSQGGFEVLDLYGCQGIGAHLQEDHLLALMDDPARWPLWRELFLATCDHPNVVGVSNHLLAVAYPQRRP
jgi:SAM-dependent methyltransferase